MIKFILQIQEPKHNHDFMALSQFSKKQWNILILEWLSVKCKCKIELHAKHTRFDKLC